MRLAAVMVTTTMIVMIWVVSKKPSMRRRWRCQVRLMGSFRVESAANDWPAVTFLAFHGTSLATSSRKSIITNIERIANAVQCHFLLSGLKDCLNSGSQLAEL